MRTGDSGTAACCFSIICKSRTLDLEHANQLVKDRWVNALREAIVFLPPLMAKAAEEQAKLESEDAMRREKRKELKKDEMVKRRDTYRQKYGLKD